MKYIYPAIFTPIENGAYLVKFPDIEGCYSDGLTLQEAYINAEDVLNLMLWELEESKTAVPVASLPQAVSVEKGAFISLISADTLAYRKLYDTKAVKKTLTIPRWLDTLAHEHNINFSNILQNALVKELGIKSTLIKGGN